MKWTAAFAAALIAASAMASQENGETIVVGYKVNGSAIGSNLTGLSSAGNFNIGTAILKGTQSWTSLADSRYLYQWDGTTTTLTSCTTGTNFFTADNTSSSYPATITWCNNFSNWMITFHNGFASGGWAIGASSSTVGDLQGAAAWITGELILGVHTVSSSCLSYSSPTCTSLIQYRDAFCEGEVQQVYSSGSGRQADNIYYLQSNAGWPTPSGSQYSGNYSGVTFTGIAGTELARGWADVSGTETREDSFFVSSGTWDANNSDVFDCWIGATGCNNITTATTVAIRRPAVAYDSSREKWVMAVQEGGSGDELFWWSSTDLTTWTSLTVPEFSFLETGKTAQDTFIYSRKPVSLFYDAHEDAFDIAWSNANPNAGALTANNFGVWNEVAVASVSASGLYAGTALGLAAGSGTITLDGPATVCNDLNADACGDLSPNPNCIVVFNKANSTMDTYARDWIAIYWPSPCSDSSTAGFSSSYAAYTLTSGTAESAFSPSMAFAHLNSSDSRGILALTVPGKNGDILLENVSLPATGGTGTGSWSSYNVTNPWNTSVDQQNPLGAMTIRADSDAQNYIITLQSNNGSHP